MGCDYMLIKSFDIESASAVLPKRDSFGNKGSFGKVLLVCGSKNMVGCCVLASCGALRSGAGLVTLAFPDVLYGALTGRLTENLFLPLNTDSNGFIDESSLQTVLDVAEKSDVVMAGCGIGTGHGPSLLTKSLLELKGKPVILDADALNCLSSDIGLLKKSDGNILLTPHSGEMARLSGKSVAEIESDRQKTVIDFCDEYKVNLLLKGHETLICNASVSEMYINKTGNSGLSKGGSGDLLSGIIAGLSCSFGGDLFKVASLGAFVHGMTADILKDSFGEYAMLPTDCAAALPHVYSLIEKGGAN